MKKIKVLVASFLLMFLAASVIGNNQVQAAYGRGKLVTTFKTLRGTWYSRDYGKRTKKMKITAHTVTLPYLSKDVPYGKYTLYRQNKSAYKNGFKYQNRANNYAAKHRWMNTWVSSQDGKEYLGIDPFWIDRGDNDFGGALSVVAVKKHGKKVKQLTLRNPNVIHRFYKSATIAKSMK